jgi:hypothetical protein
MNEGPRQRPFDLAATAHSAVGGGFSYQSQADIADSQQS